jgi:hypothetical protein
MSWILEQEMGKERMREQGQIWLQNALKEKQFGADIQKETDKRTQIRQIVDNITNPDFYKDHPYPAYKMFYTLDQTFPGYLKDLGMVVPEDFPKKEDMANEAANKVVIAQTTGTNPDPVDVKIFQEGFGISEPLKAVEDITRVKAEKEAGTFKEKQLAEDVASRLLKEREVVVKEGEFELTKKGVKTNKEIKNEIEKTENKRQAIILKLRSLAPADIQNVRNHEIYIEQLNRKIAADKKTGGIETETDKQYKPIVEALKARGVTRQILLQNKDLEKDLMAKGFMKWVILEYLR